MELTLKKRLAGFAAAGALALAMVPVAAFGVGALTPDTTLTVSGLDNGDEVSFYQVIEQADAEDGSGWKFVDQLDANGDGVLDDSNPAIKVDDLRAFANKTQYDDSKVITASMADQISALVASKRVPVAKSDTAKSGKIVVDLTTLVGADDPVPVGMYMAVVTKPSSTDVVYKPIFLSADYDQGAATATVGEHNNTNAIELDETVGTKKGTGYKDDPNIGVFKKSKLTLEKEAGDATDRKMDMAVGEIVPFTITTNLPSYTQNFESPVFVITDELTQGLVLEPANASQIEVAVAGVTLTANDYKVTVTGNNKFTVEFANDDTSEDGAKDGILYRALGNPKVTITYNAKVTDANAAAQVNQMDNDVKLNFSNNPQDKTGAGTLKDRTRHYTFGIDANIMGDGFGPDGQKTTSEIRKVAVDANGEPIYEKKTSELPNTVTGRDDCAYKWLQGAKFKLEQTAVYQDADNAGYGDKGTFAPVSPAKEIKFDGSHIQVATGGNRPESDGNGYIAMKGLDAGKYTLTEVEAPLGYTFDPSIVYEITITPSFTDDHETDPTFTDVPNKILSGYSVEITAKKGANELASTKTEYTSDTAGTPATPVSFINEGENAKGGITVTEEDAATAETALIVNKELGILPATGGSGILFYVFIGAAIMALAVFLARRNRKDAGAHAGAMA